MRSLKLGIKGMTIGTVLLLVTVGSLAVFTMVAMAFFHLRFSSAVVNNRSARNIAESALSTALVKVWEDNKYGNARNPDEFIHLTSTTDEAAEGFLSFSEAKATELGVPFSTNNFEGAAAVEGGNGRSVPANAVHLVALGTCRGARYRAEVLYYVPPYPNAMASSGPVVSTGGLLVAGIPSVEEATEITTPTGIDPDKLEPGHIISNSNSSQAIFLGPDTQIRGDVVAVGGITVNPSAEVLGEVRPNASKQMVPDFDIDSIFTRLSALKTRDKIKDPTLPGDTVIDYFSEATAPLVVQGDLVLDSGVLYCRDNLLVRGKVRGNGAILSLKDVKIESGADLTADDQVALVAKGSLELQGTDKNTQFFNGLVYSEKEILADNITIIGSAVVNGDSKSLLQLNNVSLIKSPISVSTVLGVPQEPPTSNVAALPGSKSSGIPGFWGSKTKYSYQPPGVQAQLQKTLVGGLQMTGIRLEKKKGDEQRFNILFEGVFNRGTGAINGEGDLSDAEKTSLQLAAHPYTFAGGKLFIRYDRLEAATAPEIEKAYEDLKGQIAAALPAPVPFQIQEKKKKAVFFFGSTKTSTQNFTLNPAEGLALDIPDYLRKLTGPNKVETPDIIDLSLNRVIDSIEKSRILLWQQF